MNPIQQAARLCTIRALYGNAFNDEYFEMLEKQVKIADKPRKEVCDDFIKLKQMLKEHQEAACAVLK